VALVAVCALGASLSARHAWAAAPFVQSQGGPARSSPGGPWGAPSVTYVVRTPQPNGGAPTAVIRSGAVTVAVSVPTVSSGLVGSCELRNGGFHNGLYAWDRNVSAGGPPDGSVGVLSGRARLTEGASFLTTLSQSFCVPAGAQELEFDLVALAFDLSDTFVPDAFEVSLLDTGLQPVVTSWAPFATSFVNVQEDGTVRSGPGVTVNGTVVTLDVSAVPPGLDVVLYFDLIGADGDTQGSVELDDVVLDTGGPGTTYCFGVGCPCGNDSTAGGCANSLGVGAFLRASGSTSVAADDLVLTVESIPSTYALIVGGHLSNCTQLGDGLLSVGVGPFQPSLLRFLVLQPSPGAPPQLGPGLIDYATTVLGAGGLLLPGTTWHFQAVYRDGPQSPCGFRFNLSNGVRVMFTS